MKYRDLAEDIVACIKMEVFYDLRPDTVTLATNRIEEILEDHFRFEEESEE